MGATAAMEAIFCVEAIRSGCIPPTRNLDNPDPECDLDFVPNTARPAQLSMALSAASFIVQAADKRVMAKNALMMIHSAWGVSMGNARDMREMADVLEKTGDLAGALAEQRRFHELMRSLAAEHPAVPDYRRNLASSHGGHPFAPCRSWLALISYSFFSPG